MKKRALILGISTALLAACVTDSYKGQATVNNAAKAAGASAVAGAGAGASLGGSDPKNAGFGALADGAVGVTVGAYMDHQQQEMQQTLQGTDIEVKRTAENTLGLNMPGSTTFVDNSATLTPRAQTALDSVAKVLNQYPDSTITIIGYTDDRGNDGSNLKLSEQRAASILNYLSAHKINSTRLTQRGMVESISKAPAINELRRAQSRCVELAIVANKNAGIQQEIPTQQQGYSQQQSYPQQEVYPQQQANPQQQEPPLQDGDLLQQGYPQQQY